jgi:triacylglycerol lipase
VTDPRVISYLQLCQLSYASPKAIRTRVPRLPLLTPEGSWELVWGPAHDSDNANLAYVAVYYDSPGVPAFVAVAIRGTDVAVDAWGVIVQMWEDLDVLDPEPFPWMPASSGALVAQGTLDGLGIIQQLTSGAGGPRLLRFLAEFLREAENRQAQLVVTGHSLGGCLTTVVAPWLRESLSRQGIDNAIVPVTFAAPTAGNPAFATCFFSNFASSLRYFNSLDIVPFAWENLEGIKTIYDPYGLPTPELVDIAIGAETDLMEWFGITYGQPAQDCELPGHFVPPPPKPPPSWYDEAYTQHHTTTYMKLLGGKSVAAEWPRPRVRSGV